MDDLIKRLEVATVPDRELDLAIGEVVGAADHTPGPWLIYENWREDDVFKTGQTVMAAVDGNAEKWGHRAVAYCAYGNREHGEANARLIAAAPNMLAALQEILKQYSNQDLSHVDFRVNAAHLAQAAIAKSEGRDPGREKGSTT